MTNAAALYGFEGMDDLDSAEVVQTSPKTFLDAQVQAATKGVSTVCYACKGSKVFRSYTGRIVGNCFKCSGTGSVTLRAAKMHQTKQANKAAELQERANWINEHKDVLDWINANSARNDFADSLGRQFTSRGTLSERQIAAVRENLAKAARRIEEQVKAVVSMPQTATGLDLRNVPEGFYAVPNGDTRLKVKIKKPAAPSKWAGFIFVSDGAAYGQGRNYGRQAPGKLYSGDIVAQLTAIAANPIEASAAYGKLTGTCGCCGRKLEDAQSVERGIGPICFGKVFGG